MRMVWLWAVELKRYEKIVEERAKRKLKVKLRLGRTEVIAPLPNQLEWQASATHWGSAELYVRPRPAPVESFWGALYTGGAFGESQTRSDGIEVTVGDLTLELERHTITVPEGDTASVDGQTYYVN